ncbi:reductase [Nicoliella spurrieriana]|uniref:Reductase n=1 Tax=Nicoliella spurrieriana TaxID=2925830 RepID=A0A976RRI0_9LACO|nr:reductase [Nicoliella spurrieriana]UQS86555.1 reductase [Nicoliella spurrieriana]
MLFKYKDDYQKIVYDLLSLVPNMDKMDRITDEIDWYQDDDSRNFYLWKDQNDNWSGLLGVEDKEQNLLIRRLILVPEMFTLPNCFKMLDELEKIDLGKKIVGSLETAKVCEEWEQAQNE